MNTNNEIQKGYVGLAMMMGAFRNEETRPEYALPKYNIEMSEEEIAELREELLAEKNLIAPVIDIKTKKVLTDKK